MAVDYDMEFVEQIADIVTVLRAGSIIAEGTIAEITALRRCDAFGLTEP